MSNSFENYGSPAVHLIHIIRSELCVEPETTSHSMIMPIRLIIHAERISLVIIVILHRLVDWDAFRMGCNARNVRPPSVSNFISICRKFISLYYRPSEKE